MPRTLRSSSIAPSHQDRIPVSSYRRTPTWSAASGRPLGVFFRHHGIVVWDDDPHPEGLFPKSRTPACSPVSRGRRKSRREMMSLQRELACGTLRDPDIASFARSPHPPRKTQADTGGNGNRPDGEYRPFLHCVRPREEGAHKAREIVGGFVRSSAPRFRGLHSSGRRPRDITVGGRRHGWQRHIRFMDANIPELVEMVGRKCLRRLRTFGRSSPSFDRHPRDRAARRVTSTATASRFGISIK